MERTPTKGKESKETGTGVSEGGMMGLRQAVMALFAACWLLFAASIVSISDLRFDYN